MAGENNNRIRGIGGAGNCQLVGNLVIDSSGSNSNGLVLSSLTSTQRDAVASPPAGMLIFNSTTNKLNVFNGTAWEAVTSA